MLTVRGAEWYLGLREKNMLLSVPDEKPTTVKYDTRRWGHRKRIEITGVVLGFQTQRVQNTFPDKRQVIHFTK